MSCSYIANNSATLAFRWSLLHHLISHSQNCMFIRLLEVKSVSLSYQCITYVTRSELPSASPGGMFHLARYLLCGLHIWLYQAITKKSFRHYVGSHHFRFHYFENSSNIDYCLQTLLLLPPSPYLSLGKFLCSFWAVPLIGQFPQTYLIDLVQPSAS